MSRPATRRRLALSLATALSTLAAAALAPARAASAGDVAIGDPLALTVYLPITDPAGAEAAAIALQTPGTPGYHHFLSVADFVSRYAASDAEIAAVKAILVSMGFTPGLVYPNHLAIEATAPAGTAARQLGLSLHRYTVGGRTGVASSTAMRIPARLAGHILGIGGVDTVSHATPRHRAAALPAAATQPAATTLPPGGTPGNYRPADFARFYDVLPIAARGISGRGTTIGIVTLNDFNPADAYSFWSQIGLNVSPTRVTKVDVDGGVEAAGNNADGEGETDLDVEESGALAPDASVRVYIAPNTTNATFINGFEAAASENVADTVSTSWGQPELGFFYDFATQTPADTFELQAFHAAFLEMALQGQTVYAASGDSGAFDTVRGCPFYGTPTADAPTCNAPYSVDHPAADPLVTAAGGTTRPFSLALRAGFTLSVAQEQAWGWDYISNEAAASGHADAISVADVFSVGDGGGVSSYFTLPWYQFRVPGITLTKPGQLFEANFGTGPQLQQALLPLFPGRNMPDLSANADPESGYATISEGAVVSGYGGTSFVAPQLNGVTALFVQALGSRVGQINPALYRLGSAASTDIRAGDNWGYAATSGYDNAVGVGVLDASRLLSGLLALQAAGR
ncbi:MAG: S53 family peptidase [Janthinobacterium lividum]